MPERVCPTEGCGYAVADHSGTATSRSFPTACPSCGTSLTAPDRETDDIPAEVREFAEQHGLDPAEVAERRAER